MPIDDVDDAAEMLADGGLPQAATVSVALAAAADVDPVPIGDPDDDEGYDDDEDDDEEEEEDDEEPLQCFGCDRTPAAGRRAQNACG